MLLAFVIWVWCWAVSYQDSPECKGRGCPLKSDYLFAVQFAHDAYTDRSAGDLVKFGACGGMSARVVQFIDLQQTGTEVMLYQVLPASMNTFVLIPLVANGHEGKRQVCVQSLMR